jgi:nucleotide-binding universal stress UspA family protein
MKILLATDFSPASDAMIGEVQARPWPEGTEALILHVVDVMVGGPGRLDLSPYIERQTEEAKGRLQAAAARLSSTKISVSTDVIDGHSAVAVPDYARDWKADLVLLGSHGQSALARFLLGSVAVSTLRHAPCSVEIVRGAEKEGAGVKGFKILLATDGSECSHSAARSIAERPWPERTEVEVLCVSGFSLQPIGSEYVPPEVVDQLLEDNLKQSWRAADEAQQILQPSKLKVAPKVITGLPKAVIVGEAADWKADLIVVGSHGHRGLERILVGSVSEAVAIHAPCSVEVAKTTSLVST